MDEAFGNLLDLIIAVERFDERGVIACHGERTREDRTVGELRDHVVEHRAVAVGVGTARDLVAVRVVHRPVAVQFPVGAPLGALHDDVRLGGVEAGVREERRDRDAARVEVDRAGVERLDGASGAEEAGGGDDGFRRGLELVRREEERDVQVMRESVVRGESRISAPVAGEAILPAQLLRP